MVQSITPPAELYARYNQLDFCPQNKSEVVANMAGNPLGKKRSWVSYIYAVSGNTRKKENFESIYFLKLYYDWPISGKFADETQDGAGHRNLDYYKSQGYLGVVRSFACGSRVIIFDPVYYLKSVYDTGRNVCVYDKGDSIGDDLTSSDALALINGPESQSSQSTLNVFMLSHIGKDYIHFKRDVFCISEIARRHGISPGTVFSKLKTIIGRVTVNKASGCWVSLNKSDYAHLFWLALGGIHFQDVFRFPHDMTDGSIQPPVIKNKSVLHHPICELTLKKDHTKCCRPSHLRLGTSMENAYHIKIRRCMEQLFDFTPEQLKKYVHHINAIANLIQIQTCTATPDEAKTRKNPSRHKGVVHFTDPEGKEEVKIIGKPDMGDKPEWVPEDDTKEWTENSERKGTIFEDSIQKCKEKYTK